MDTILNRPLRPDEIGLWYLGQAGYVIRSAGRTVAIDPYLTDSAAERAPACTRLLPVPIRPEDLRVDVFIVTHDHLDHLDPQTIRRYPAKESTMFVAPHLACETPRALGVPEANITCVDVGAKAALNGMTIEGIYALATDKKTADTAGYVIRFESGRSVYHSADTGFCPRLLESPPAAEALLVCINGRWGNLSAAEAAKLAAAVRPRFAIPNHYDMMRPNMADPADFARLVNHLTASLLRFARPRYNAP